MALWLLNRALHRAIGVASYLTSLMASSFPSFESSLLSLHGISWHFAYNTELCNASLCRFLNIELAPPFLGSLSMFCFPTRLP